VEEARRSSDFFISYLEERGLRSIAAGVCPLYSKRVFQAGLAFLELENSLSNVIYDS